MNPQTQNPRDAAFSALLQQHNYQPQSSSFPSAGGWYSKLQTSSPQAPATPNLASSYGKSVADTFQGGISNIKAGVSDLFTPSASANWEGGNLRGGSASDLATGGLMSAAGAGAHAVASLGQIVGGIGQAVTSPITGPVSAVGTAIGNKVGQAAPVAPFQALNSIMDAHPGIGKYSTDVMNLANLAIPDVAEKGAPLVGAAGTEVKNIGSDISHYLSSPVEKFPTAVPHEAPGGMTDSIRSYFAKDNVDPRLAATAQRLDDPVTAYKDYAGQADAAVKDVKADPPIAKVGENIGNAYDQVVKMRRTVGAQMADELSKVKDTPVDLYKVPEEGKPIIGEGSKFSTDVQAGVGKMTSFDKQLISQYTLEVKKLGANPTAGMIDDFLSRVPNELDVAKAAKNITDITNAERIIKGNLADIRKALTSQPGMEGYAAARNGYSELSNFLDQGSQYLGGKTASGDFARDASVAKSSAESIVNGGKKDWLIKLEGLTGYKALDDATLAIQAMKDAGDPRGMSLFKSLGEGATHPTGLLYKTLQWGANKVAGHVLGTDAQQTEAFLKSISNDPSASAGVSNTESPQTGMPPELQVKSSSAEYTPKSKTGQYLQNNPPSMGLAMKSNVPKPEVVAENLSIGEYKALKEYIIAHEAGKDSGLTGNMKVQEIFDKHGIEPTTLPKNKNAAPVFASEDARVGYAQDLVSSYEDSLGNSPKVTGGAPTNAMTPLAKEAQKYKSAEEFVKAQPLSYHGSTVPLKSFNNKTGAFFTDDMMNADGYGNGENVYEGHLNLKNPLVIDAKGKRYDNLDTPYGKSTQEIVGNVDSKKYDGVIFKNVKDSFSDGEEHEQEPGTISYAFKPKDAFLNESQLTDFYNKVKGKK